MTEVIEVTNELTLDTIVQENDDVVIKFTAPSWCVPCQRFAPHYKNAAARLPDITFVSVDVDNAPWAMESYGVQSVPTVVRVKNGEVTPVASRTLPLLVKELS